MSILTIVPTVFFTKLLISTNCILSVQVFVESDEIVNMCYAILLNYSMLINNFKPQKNPFQIIF